MTRQIPLADRIESFSFPEPNSGCHIWIGHSTLGKRPRIQVSNPRRNEYAYRAVWELHNGKIPTGMYVCHKCDNSLCVNVDHLFLGTAQDNSSDAVIKGRTLYGENHRDVRLSENDIPDIRLFWNSGIQQKEIAKIYNVAPSTIGQIIRGESWKHLN